jgi:Protein of unknown function (DUF1622)
LEILVAADLSRTVARSPTLQNVLILGVIVLIPTFLSFSLEIDGVAPWRRALFPGIPHGGRIPLAAPGESAGP